jgi:hypothetical protein
MSIKFDSFTTDIAETYLLKSLQEEDFWIFGSFPGETSIPVSENTEKTQRKFLEKTIFGVSVTDFDFAALVNLNIWEEGRIYTEYDDAKNIGLTINTPFYVVTPPNSTGGSHHIFKCISNNYSSTSTEKPIFEDSINQLDGIYYLSDGYVWKYMITVPSFAFSKFGGSGYIPIIRNAQVETIANEGIYSILVTNRSTNSGYERLTGTITSLDSNNRIIIRINGNIPFNKSPNIYANRTLIVNPGTSSQEIDTQLFKILASGELNGQNFIQIETTAAELNLESLIEIVPTIEIIGDGSGAKAIAIFDDTNTLITSVKMIDSGINYQNANARVIDPSVNFDTTNPNRSDIECILRPIISPKGGHGSNPVKEFKSKNISISVNITSKDSSNVTDTNSYSKIGLVKNPLFAEVITENTFDSRLKLQTTDGVLGLSVGETLSQSNGVSGIIHEIDNDVLYLTEYDGAFSAEFDESLLVSSSSGINFSINTITKASYVSKTGSVLFISDLTPVDRSDEKVEQIKLIIDF